MGKNIETFKTEALEKAKKYYPAGTVYRFNGNGTFISSGEFECDNNYGMVRDVNTGNPVSLSISSWGKIIK